MRRHFYYRPSLFETQESVSILLGSLARHRSAMMFTLLGAFTLVALRVLRHICTWTDCNGLVSFV